MQTISQSGLKDLVVNYRKDGGPNGSEVYVCIDWGVCLLGKLHCNLEKDSGLLHQAAASIPQSTGAGGSSGFWTAFQTADYASSDHALSLLSQASAADPSDNHLIELTGLCSFWKVVEHGRAGIPAQQLTGLAQQSLAYVEEAARREPQNRLIPGFISSAKYQAGAMTCNVDMMRQAMCELQHNTEVYPQFHGFVEGWVLTAMLPPNHPAYEQAVEAYFKTLDSCAGIRVPRSFPKIGPIGLSILAKKSAQETVCYNTNIAPHNVEGTMLGLGDALVKQGKLRQAKMAYESIPKIPAYVNWPFKEASRIASRIWNLCSKNGLRNRDA